MGPFLFAVVLPFIVLGLTPIMRWLDRRDAEKTATPLAGAPVAAVEVQAQLPLPLVERPSQAKARASRPPPASAHP